MNDREALEAVKALRESLCDAGGLDDLSGQAEEVGHLRDTIEDEELLTDDAVDLLSEAATRLDEMLDAFTDVLTALGKVIGE